MNFVYFGPPGVGKSTLVKALHGIDLELVPTALRKRFARGMIVRGNGLVVGAADTQPGMYPASSWVRVLLLPPRSVYDARRAQRDADKPEKASQPDVYSNFEKDKGSFDLVLSEWELP